MEDKYLTYEEVAERWRLKVQTVRALVMEKRLKPSFVIGGRVRFLESYIEQKEAGGKV